ncbi:MAG: tetratricopeptide repeat protein [Planctomyces sp.]|nr:tetratricopeptide repeat protein [Planctomyces sp.]
MNANLQRAILLFQQSRYEMAVPLLRLTLTEEPSNAEAHAILSMCLDELKQYDDATDEAKQAIFHAPDEPLGHYALACVLESRNRLKEARTAISAAIRIAPHASQYFARLSSIEANDNQWKACLDAADNGLAVDPEDLQCLNLRALALTRLGRKAEAGETIVESLRQNPDDAFSHANEGWRQIQLGDPQKALVHFGEALRLNPNLAWARRGTIEAMKSKNFLYRWVLYFVLWLNRFPPKVQVLLVLGIVFGQRLLQSLVQAIPGLAMFAPFLALAYILFVWLTWVSSSLFNLLLMTDRFGRLVLNRKEKAEALLTGGCIALCGVFVALGCSIGLITASVMVRSVLGALLFLGVVIPIRAVFSLTDIRQKLFAVWTVGVFGVVLIHNGMMVQIPFKISSWIRESAEVTGQAGVSPADQPPNPELEELKLVAKEISPEVATDIEMELGRRMKDAPLEAKIYVIRRLNPEFDRAVVWWGRGIDGIVYSTWATLLLSMIPVRK